MTYQKIRLDQLLSEVLLPDAESSSTPLSQQLILDINRVACTLLARCNQVLMLGRRLKFFDKAMLCTKEGFPHNTLCMCLLTFLISSYLTDT